MERPVRINTIILDKYSPDRFALQQVFKKSGVIYEYKQDENWSSEKPRQKPDGTRVVFGDISDFRAAKDVYFVWQDIICQKAYDPALPEKIVSRLLEARKTEEDLVLFVPWGVRPAGTPRYEKTVMDKIANFQKGLKQRNINAAVLIMPADVYATEINSISPSLADPYFTFIANLALTMGFKVKPWSEIRQENQKYYDGRAKELDYKAIEKLVGYKKVLEAMETAKRRSGYSNPKEIERAGLNYLRERVCEAEIIESVYQPIKVSAVSKNKDSEVDRELPRIYIIPDEYQFPWLK